MDCEAFRGEFPPPASPRGGVPHRTHQRPTPKTQELFIKGPIPLAWLREAAFARGASLALGLALWFQHGLRGKDANPIIRLSAATLKALGLSRDQATRAVRSLEKRGLVQVVSRGVGRCTLVTIVRTPNPSSLSTSPQRAEVGHPPSDSTRAQP
jgi:hypothetical protein